MNATNVIGRAAAQCLCSMTTTTVSTTPVIAIGLHSERLALRRAARSNTPTEAYVTSSNSSTVIREVRIVAGVTKGNEKIVVA